MPIFAMVVWILDAINSDSDPMPQRQVNRTTLMICGSTGIPAYPMAITKGEAATLLVPRSKGSVYGTNTLMRMHDVRKMRMIRTKRFLAARGMS
jgi:hypothetical protein